jgi:small basic protein (TIGR04137 family)
MSMDRSLKVKGALTRHRNVLTRGERVERLRKEEKWQEGDTLLGLPKVANRKSRASKKDEKTVAKEGEAAVAAAAGTAEQAGKTPAGAAKTKTTDTKAKAADVKGKTAEVKTKTAAPKAKAAEGKK